MRRTRSHLFETLYILGMITLIASVLIGAISWLGRNTLYFIGTTAESAGRVACSGFEDQPPPTTTSLGWRGFSDLPVSQWPAHLSTLMQAGAADDCATAYDPDYVALMAYRDRALNDAKKSPSIGKALAPPKSNAYQTQARGLTPEWHPLMRWAVSQGYVLLQRPTRDIVADVSAIASLGGEVLGVNDMVRALDLNGLLSAVGGEAIVSDIQGQLIGKMYEAAGTSNPAFTQVTLLATPQMQVSAAPPPLKGYVAAMPFSVTGINGADDRLWLVLHIIQPNATRPDTLSIKRWVSRPLP